MKLLLENGFVQEHTDFGKNMLIYMVKLLKDAETLSVSLFDGTITLIMPETMAKEWSATDRVGYDREEDGLYMLIEKDFQCLDEVAEDQSDNYPNPLAEKRA